MVLHHSNSTGAVDAHDEQFKGPQHLPLAIQSDDIRTEAAIASVRVDVDTIKRRLNLSDSTNQCRART